MTKTEASRLVDDVIACAPESMGAGHSKDLKQEKEWPDDNPNPFAWFDGAPEEFSCIDGIFVDACFDPLTELWSAAGTLALLNALEKGGFYVCVEPIDGGYKASIGVESPCLNEELEFYGGDGFVGKTRAEAVGKAFVACFGGQE